MASSGVSAGLKTTGPFETVASPVGSNKLAYSERPEALAGGFGFEGFDIVRARVRVRVYDLKLLNASSYGFRRSSLARLRSVHLSRAAFTWLLFQAISALLAINLRHHQTIANLEAGVPVKKI
jgi:hypothetical protein